MSQRARGRLKAAEATGGRMKTSKWTRSEYNTVRNVLALGVDSGEICGVGHVLKRNYKEGKDFKGSLRYVES